MQLYFIFIQRLTFDKISEIQFFDEPNLFFNRNLFAIYGLNESNSKNPKPLFIDTER